ncbi:hypothetical protein [Nocardiopsis dassonvillei]|uniref:hypothetical protein n=1 Tax=Nocardiopsis dassonvillei TaxID=2014 RepID=UPI0033FA85C3
MHLTLSYSHQGCGGARARRRQVLAAGAALATIVSTAVAVAAWMGWTPFTG